MNCCIKNSQFSTSWSSHMPPLVREESMKAMSPFLVCKVESVAVAGTCSCSNTCSSKKKARSFSSRSHSSCLCSLSPTLFTLFAPIRICCWKKSPNILMATKLTKVRERYLPDCSRSSPFGGRSGLHFTGGGRGSHWSLYRGSGNKDGIQKRQPKKRAVMSCWPGNPDSCYDLKHNFV